jgi:hypothetical protein
MDHENLNDSGPALLFEDTNLLCFAQLSYPLFQTFTLQVWMLLPNSFDEQVLRMLIDSAHPSPIGKEICIPASARIGILVI